MRKRMIPFVSGMLTMALIGTLSIGALAASGAMTITVDTIDIQVNGETFVPTDVNGVEVPVFAYNGTTYVPLRALAEAYGLEVGYDAESNIATVTDPAMVSGTGSTLTVDYSDWSAEKDAAYQEFRGMWSEPEMWSSGDYGVVDYIGGLSSEELVEYLRQTGEERIIEFQIRFGTELCEAQKADPRRFRIAFAIFNKVNSAGGPTGSTYDETDVIRHIEGQQF
ncbi:stalk domain-containing protein [Intestinimonas butyriciproducens]|uniref:stalk domain-containing protein n=1 Tax=Intestinimonas butyriciproducens TaxID=1297617 RepID=UPI001898C5AD|nr:stalk domain-containing protein [Intestinimonas butyriciproducens]MDB7829108.1 stalk domain-containing protein [Intestinimonas butyriciproducens]